MPVVWVPYAKPYLINRAVILLNLTWSLTWGITRGDDMYNCLNLHPQPFITMQHSSYGAHLNSQFLNYISLLNHIEIG